MASTPYLQGYPIKPASISGTGIVTFTDGRYSVEPNQQQCEAYGYTYNPITGTCNAFTFSTNLNTAINNETNIVSGQGNVTGVGTGNTHIIGQSNEVLEPTRNNLIVGSQNQITYNVDNTASFGTLGEVTATNSIVLGGNAGTDTIQFQGKIDGDIISEAAGNTLGDATNPWEIIANTVKANLTTGVDNSVVIKDADGFLKTDEIDSRVWGSSLVDATTGAATRIATFTDANSIEGDANVTWDGNELIVQGALTANEKNFDIPHPSKEGWRLRHSVMEGPERGVYVRGKIKGNKTITLPDYWKDLVYEDSISVQLTAIGKSRAHHVVDVNTSTITVGCTFGSINAYYHVYAERKADTPVLVEYEVTENITK